MRGARFALALAALLAAPGAAEPADEACEALEAQGLYDRRAQGGPLDDFERVRRWLVDSAPLGLESASASAAQLGVSKEIFALRLDGTTARADFPRWLAALGRTDFTALPPSPLLARVAAEASAALIAAFERCIARPGLHLWTESTLDPAVFQIHARHNPEPGTGGAGPPLLERVVATEGPDARALECTPDLPRARRMLLLRRRPRLEGELAATCLRANPTHGAQVLLETAELAWLRRVPPTAGPRRHPASRVAPTLACAAAEAERAPSGLRVVTECEASTGERSRRSRRHPGWNGRAQARSLCPHRDLDAEATTALQLRCRPQDDGSVELLVAGELTARAGWNRKGCVPSDPESGTHCAATARIEGRTATPLWVDLTSAHCVRVVRHTRRGTGEPANNGSRDFGPLEFDARYLRLRDPEGREVSLDAGSERALDVPGRWEIVAGGSEGPMPDGWRHRASRNRRAGTYRFRESLRLAFPPLRTDGTCTGAEAVTRPSTGSAP